MKNEIINNLKNLSKNLITIFFLFLFIGSIFAYNVDASRLKENLVNTNSKCNTYIAKEGVSEFNYIFNRGDGCYTVELPKESVQKIWDDILVKGFKIDQVSSDQKANRQRPTLEKNELLITEPGAKAGDLAIKKEMPNQMIDTIEVPSLINQSCTGSFQYGLNLNTTLRVGRCLDSKKGCYTNGDGLFRQNGQTGFFKEATTVGKDIIDAIGLNKAKEIAGETITGDDYSSNIELGVFSDMSVMELQQFRKDMELADTNEINLDQMKVIIDKAISNSYEVGNFAADMQTTCRGENCYINSYSLFDKMFNQYFSVDMVLSSASPIIMNGAANILRNPKVSKKYDFIPNSLKKTGIVKEGGFWDQLISEPANLIRNPKDALSKALRVKNASVKQMKNLGDVWAKPGVFSGHTPKEIRLRDAQNNGFQTQINELLSSSTFTSPKKNKEFQEFLMTEYANEKTLKGLSAAGKRGLYNQTAQYTERLDEVSKIISGLKNDDVFKSAYKKLATGKAARKSNIEIYASLTDNELLKLGEAATAASTAQKIIKDQTFDNIDVGVKLKTKDLIADRTQTIKYIDTTGNPVSFDASTNVYKTKTEIKSLDTRVYDLSIKDGDLIPSVKSYEDATSESITYISANGTPITLSKPVPYIRQIDYSSGFELKNIDNIMNFKKQNPNGFIKYREIATGDIKTISVTSFDEKALKGKIQDITGYKSNIKSLKEIKTIDPTFEYMDYAVDPLDSIYDIMETVPKTVDNTTTNLKSALTTFQNKNMTDVKSINWINERMNSLSGHSYWGDWLQKPLQSFGYNFVYWELRSMGGEILGLDKWSMYRLPDTYSAISINHGETPDIYKDAYIDYFANDGSDQGDIFMAYLNSAAFYIPWLAKKGIELVPGELAGSVNRTLDKVLKGKIRRNKVDNIVLFTDTINTGCGTSCTININSSQYIEQKTKQKTLEGINKKELPGVFDNLIVQPIKNNIREKIVDQVIQEQYQQMDYSATEMQSGLERLGTEQKDIDNITQMYKTQYKQAIDTAKPVIDTKINNKMEGISDDFSISFTVPVGILVNNYVLENTSKKNLEKKGQTLISFSHHTDFDGTTANGTNKDAINLIKAKSEKNTCEQKIKKLKIIGMPIGYVLPKNHRVAGAMLLQEHLAYIAMPGYKNTWIAAALSSSVPQQVLIMPELYNCVDDQEGRYAHFFVSTLEDDRIKGDTTNKVGDMVLEGVENVEKSLNNVSNGTEFEKTISAGTTHAKEFINKNLKDYPIVQSRFTTSGSTNANVNGQLFFIELGPNTSCRANALSGNGTEILTDNNLKASLNINKENGILSVIDEKGNINTIIDSENSDFVRLSSTNLGIPAKIIPHSLSYIPLSDTNTELFEMDVYGNLIVLDDSFLDCLQAGYEAQTGLISETNSRNLVDYLGPVKNINVLNSLTNYDVYPQNTKIVAEGTPRQVANNKLAKLKINSNRKSTLTKVKENSEVTLGKNIAIQFEKGQLIYSGEKNAYIMWIEHTTITNSQDIKFMKTELIKEKTNNGCDVDEIALNFKTTSTNNNKDSQAYNNVNKLNKAFENVGPFKMFDTPTKTFIFYVSKPPECEQRMKIIDKETGEVYDQKITDIQETPNGIKIKTEDGTTHDLKFSADNGIPELTYNGDSETLLSAQGENGSFWYDPQTGNWYTENGHMIPFNSDFKDGLMFSANKNGEVVGTPAQNVFNIGDNGKSNQGGGFNIPLSPISTINLILYLFTILFGFILVNRNSKIKIKKKSNTKK